MNLKKLLNPLINLIIILALPVIATADHSDKAIRFGSVAMDTPRAMHYRLLPLTHYLSDALERPIELVPAPNMRTAIDDVAAGRVDVAYLTPVAYLRTKEKSNSRLIAKLETDNRASFKLMIVVRDDSPIKTVADLRGKTFAFGDPSAMLQRAVVVGAGINLDELKHYAFVDHYDNIIRGVLHRDYDAGVIKDTEAYRWEEKGIRIIYSSDELPPFNITAAQQVDDNLLERLREAFLKLDINNPKHRKVIKALDPKYSGFAATNDGDYDIVRKLIKPFETPAK